MSSYRTRIPLGVFSSNLCDDLAYKLCEEHNIPSPTVEEIYNYGLYLYDRILLEQSGQDLSCFLHIPTPMRHWSRCHGNSYIEEQLNWNYK